MASINQVSERAARIDGLLTQLGAQGSNLREKASSLAGQLSSQTVSDLQQLDYLRENAAQTGGLSDIEVERFTRLSDSVTNELQGLQRAPEASYAPVGTGAATPQPQAAWDTPTTTAGWGAGTGNLNMTGIPEKLKFITIPLLIMLVLQVFGLIFTPFMGPMLSTIFNEMALDPSSGITTSDLGILKMFTGATVWITFLFMLAWAAFLYFTYRAIGQGKAWARVAVIVIAVLSLLSFPIGTILAIFMLIGAFDQGVQRFATR